MEPRPKRNTPTTIMTKATKQEAAFLRLINDGSCLSVTCSKQIPIENRKIKVNESSRG